MRDAAAIGKVGEIFSACAPGLPGCIAISEAWADVEREIRAAIRFHIEGTRGGRSVGSTASALGGMVEGMDGSRVTAFSCVTSR